MRRPTARFSMDDSRWPLVVFKYVGSLGDDDFRALFQALEGLYQRAEPFYAIHDGVSANTVPHAGQRKLVVDNAREHEPMLRKWVVGNAVVAPNPLMRGVLTAICWLSPSSAAATACATMSEALDVATRALAARGLAIPPRRRSLSPPAA